MYALTFPVAKLECFGCSLHFFLNGYHLNFQVKNMIAPFAIINLSCILELWFCGTLDKGLFFLVYIVNAAACLSVNKLCIEHQIFKFCDLLSKHAESQHEAPLGR